MSRCTRNPLLFDRMSSCPSHSNSSSLILFVLSYRLSSLHPLHPPPLLSYSLTFFYLSFIPFIAVLSFTTSSYHMRLFLHHIPSKLPLKLPIVTLLTHHHSPSQVDMQQLLDEQMRRKLSKLEMGTSSRAPHHHHNQSDSDSSSSGKASPRKNSRLFAILTTLKR